MNARAICCTLLVVVGLLLSSSAGSPNHQRRTRDAKAENLVGIASNIVATTILQGNADTNKNFVFSPLGYSSILAILSEGARGDTVSDIASVLRLPAERTRAYREALSHLQGDNPLIAPQFKTWLYIYRNNTVEETFRTSIRDNFFVDVKDIDRLDWSDDKDDKGEPDAVEEPITAAVDPADEATQPISEIDIDTDKTPLETDELPTNSENSKDIPDFETLKIKNPIDDDDATRLIDDQKDASKFDEVVEDKQYVEAPVIRETISKQKEKLVEQAKLAIVADNNEYVAESVKTAEGIKAIRAEIKETVRERSGALDSMEIMEAQESHFGSREFGARGDGDVASVISGNSLVGKKENTKAGDTVATESKLILFNGLYYRGNWAIPFQQLRSESDNVFYTSETEKVATKMMRARGSYRIATLKDLKAQAIELPYDNERYALLIVLPNARNGLRYVLNDFTPAILTGITEQLEEESIDICMPKFSLDTTSGAEKQLAKAGLTTMFTSKADFSGISTVQHLHVDELQQHVSVRVDEGSSSENFLTSTNALRSNARAEQFVQVDRPFLFFVRDIVDDIIIVAGKMVEPTANVNEPSI